MSFGKDLNQDVMHSTNSCLKLLGPYTDEAHISPGLWNPTNTIISNDATSSSSMSLASPSFKSASNSVPLSTRARRQRARPSRTNSTSASTALLTSASASNSSLSFASSFPPSASMDANGTGDPTLLINLIKGVSKQVDENSNIKRRFLERAQALAKMKERALRAKELRMKEARARDANARSQAIRRLRKKEEKEKEPATDELGAVANGTRCLTSKTALHPVPGVEDVDDAAMEVDGGICVEDRSASTSSTIVKGKGNMPPPPPPLSRRKSSGRSSNSSHLYRESSNPIASTSSTMPPPPPPERHPYPHADLFSSSYKPDSAMSHTSLPSPISPGAQAPSLDRPVVPPPQTRRPVNPPRLQNHDVHAARHRQPLQLSPPACILPAGISNPILPSTPPYLSQGSSQTQLAKLKSKPPVLGMRRGVGAVAIQEAVGPTQTPKTQEAHNAQKTLDLPAKQRSFKIPFAKPALPTLLATDAQKVQGMSKPSAKVHAATHKSLPTPDTTPSPHFTTPYVRPAILLPPQRPIAPLGNMPAGSRVDTFKGGRSSSPAPEADTSFGSEFDLGFDAEELERACSVYD